MSTLNTIDLRMLKPEQAAQVLGWYREALKNEDVTMSYHEVAWMYGYQYQTIRLLVSRKQIRTEGRRPNRRITHQVMRAYIASKKKEGRFRDTLKEAQSRIA